MRKHVVHMTTDNCCSNNTRVSTTAASVPVVITFAVLFTQGPNKRISKCNAFGIKTEDAGSTVKLHQAPENTSK